MKLIYCLFICLLTSIVPINAQKQNNTKPTELIIPKITPEFEKLDTLEYLQIKEEGKTYGRKILSDGTSIYINKKEDRYIYIKVLPTSYFAVVKNYYLNGNIKYKGLFSNFKDILKGKWYEYDENGKISNKGDYDAPYKYGFEKILAFCQKEGMVLKTGKLDPKDLYRGVMIGRQINTDTQRPEWVITNFIEADYAIRYIWIDGITGDPIHDYIMPIARH